MEFVRLLQCTDGSLIRYPLEYYINLLLLQFLGGDFWSTSTSLEVEAVKHTGGYHQYRGQHSYVFSAVSEITFSYIKFLVTRGLAKIFEQIDPKIYIITLIFKTTGSNAKIFVLDSCCRERLKHHTMT